MIAKFHGNPATNVIVTYAPCEYANENVKNSFYNQLQQTIEEIQAHNFLIILSDMNAKLGPETVKYTYNALTNDNGRRLNDTMEEAQLIAANTEFHKKKGKLWTWLSPRSTKHQLDYILVRKKWRKTIRNCEAYNSFTSLGSDHRIVVADISLSLRATKNAKKRKPKYVWSDLREQKELQNKYATALRDKFNNIIPEKETITEKYERLMEANGKAAAECMRQVPVTKKKIISQDPRITKARNAITSIHKTHKPPIHLRYKSRRNWNCLKCTKKSRKLIWKRK